MFLCLTLTIAPIGLAILAFLLTTIGAFVAPIYPASQALSTLEVF